MFGLVVDDEDAGLVARRAPVPGGSCDRGRWTWTRGDLLPARLPAEPVYQLWVVCGSPVISPRARRPARGPASGPGRGRGAMGGTPTGWCASSPRHSGDGPDPESAATFEGARLRWDERVEGHHGTMLLVPRPDRVLRRSTRTCSTTASTGPGWRRIRPTARSPCTGGRRRCWRTCRPSGGRSWLSGTPRWSRPPARRSWTCTTACGRRRCQRSSRVPP